jgi:hypothetical protein
MAASYIVVSQTPGVQVLGPTQVMDVETVGITTLPTGIYLEYPIDRASWQADHGTQLLSAIAEAVEGIIDAGLAVDGSYVQDLRPSGLLADYIDFIVEYTPPDGVRPTMTAEARVPIGALIAGVDPFTFNLAGNPRDILIATFDALVATANQ